MFKKFIVLLFLVICFTNLIIADEDIELGNGLYRTFNLALQGIEVQLPTTTTAAVAMGFDRLNVIASCDSRLGYRWTPNGDDPALYTSPLSVWFSAGGQITGLQVDVFGEGAAPDYLVDEGIWIQVEENHWTLSVAFRDNDDICDDEHTYDELLGDRLIVNPHSLKQKLPITEEDAVCEDWTLGSGMKTMGNHYSLNLGGQDDLWNSNKLFPVVLMFHPTNGALNAFFFTSPIPQIDGSGDDQFWEGTALPPLFMCDNWCDEDCTFEVPVAWSTMHIYFDSDYLTLTMPDPDDSFVGRQCMDVKTCEDDGDDDDSSQNLISSMLFIIISTIIVLMF